MLVWWVLAAVAGAEADEREGLLEVDLFPPLLRLDEGKKIGMEDELVPPTRRKDKDGLLALLEANEEIKENIIGEGLLLTEAAETAKYH